MNEILIGQVVLVQTATVKALGILQCTDPVILRSAITDQQVECALIKLDNVLELEYFPATCENPLSYQQVKCFLPLSKPLVTMKEYHEHIAQTR